MNAPVRPMKALTFWQPWASLVMLGAKPYEFRRWTFERGRRAEPGLVGKRIAVHAGARPARLEEVRDILARLNDGSSALEPESARPALERLRKQLLEAKRDREQWRAECIARRAEIRRRAKRGPFKGDQPLDVSMPPEPDAGQPILSAVLGTVVLGRPVRAVDLFGDAYDSDRIDHAVWAWPLTDIDPFPEPVPCRGAQGFWNFA